MKVFVNGKMGLARKRGQFVGCGCFFNAEDRGEEEEGLVVQRAPPRVRGFRYRGMLYINRICRSTWSPLNSTGSDGNGFDALIAATAASFSAREFDCPL